MFVRFLDLINAKVKIVLLGQAKTECQKSVRKFENLSNSLSNMAEKQRNDKNAVNLIRGLRV